MTKKTKEPTIDTADLYKRISKGIGGELLEDRDKSAYGYVDTGILGFNYILSGKFVGGGVPGGTCVEAFGNSSSGKSLLGTNMLRGCQTAEGIAVMLDSERTISKDFAVKASHVDPNKFFLIEPDTLEAAFNRIHKTIRFVRGDAKIGFERPIVIVYDSIAQSPSEREFAETDIDMEEASKAAIKEAGAGADKPGERGKICSKELRKMPPILANNNVILFVINQTRMKIGVMFGDPEDSAGGGLALKFATSIRVRLRSSKHIKDTLGNTIGINVNIQCVKNKCFRPFTEIRGVRLFFDRGIDPFSGLLEILLACGRIEPFKKEGKLQAGTYKVKEPWAGGQEITFKSSKERNDVPADLLLKCPALVDATDVSQIEYYTTMFGNALVNADDIVETEAQGED